LHGKILKESVWTLMCIAFPTVLGGFFEKEQNRYFECLSRKQYSFEEVIHYEVRIHIHVYHVLCTENYNTGTNKNGS
jgi:hypothetical protein